MVASHRRMIHCFLHGEQIIDGCVVECPVCKHGEERNAILERFEERRRQGLPTIDFTYD